MDKKTKTKKRDKLGRGQNASAYTYAMLSFAGVMAFLIIWQLLLAAGIVSDRYLAKPTELVV